MLQKKDIYICHKHGFEAVKSHPQCQPRYHPRDTSHGCQLTHKSKRDSTHVTQNLIYWDWYLHFNLR